MPVQLIGGDLFSADADIIGHGVNCAGGFNSGVAGEIARRWPRVREAYMFKHMRSGWNLGDIQYVSAFEYKTLPLIANMAMQQTYGHEDKVYIDYDAVQMCLDSLLSYAASLGYSVALPKIGCDLANGDWKTVEGILRDVSAWHPTVDVSVYYLENERAMNEIYV